MCNMHIYIYIHTNIYICLCTSWATLYITDIYTDYCLQNTSVNILLSDSQQQTCEAGITSYKEELTGGGQALRLRALSCY